MEKMKVKKRNNKNIIKKIKIKILNYDEKEILENEK